MKKHIDNYSCELKTTADGVALLSVYHKTAHRFIESAASDRHGCMDLEYIFENLDRESIEYFCKNGISDVWCEYGWEYTVDLEPGKTYYATRPAYLL